MQAFQSSIVKQISTSFIIYIVSTMQKKKKISILPVYFRYLIDIYCKGESVYLQFLLQENFPH